MKNRLAHVLSHLPISQGLGRTLFLSFLAISLIPLAVVSKIGYESANTHLLQSVEDSLTAASQLKSERLEGYLAERLFTLREQSGVQANINLTTELNKLFQNSGGDFRAVQRAPEWPVLVDGEAEGLREVMKRDTLFDVLIVGKNGELLFSASETEKLGRNLFLDAETPLSRTCRRTLGTGKPACSDVDIRGQDHEHQIIYLAHPVRSDTAAIEGIMVFTISMRQINQVMRERSWLGRTGELYLVGEDMEIRSEIAGKNHYGRGSHRADTPIVRHWLAMRGKEGKTTNDAFPYEQPLDPAAILDATHASSRAMLYENPWMEKVMGVYAEIPLLKNLGLHWIVVAEVTAAEAFDPGRALQRKILTWMSLTAFIILVFSGYLAGIMVQPLRGLSGWARRVAAGDLSYEDDGRPLHNEIGEMRESFKGVVDAFRSISEVCEAIAVGDLSKRVHIKSERDILGKSVNQMGDNLSSVVRQANRIADGDYSIEIQPRSPHDELGIALDHMTSTLRAVTAENTRSLDEARKLIYSLDNLPSPIYTVDRDFNVLYMNPAAAELAGLPVADCIGAKCQGLFRSTLCHTRNCPAEKVKREDRIMSGENTVDPDDINIPVEYMATPIHDSHGNVDSVLLHLNIIVQRKKVMEEIRRREWVRTGQVRLGEILRGVHDMKVLAKNIITFLVNYLDAGIGAIYLVDEEETLHLLASYAYPRPELIKTTFHFGEGLVGETALTGKTNHIEEIPDDYIPIHSAFGGTKPKSILIMPFIFDGQVKGVMEMGSFMGFTASHLEFLDQIVEYIGIAIATSQSRKKLEELLIETQLQAEQLLVQQEELRQANEELEEQTKALTASEEELQAQQEELRVTNEELEERSHALEEQQENIKRKNDELEDTRKRLELKTKDLETISRYKSEFLANMSHELRTPLNSMLLLSNLLFSNKEGNLTEKHVEYAKTIHTAGTDLLRLINDILDLSKVEAGKIALHIDSISLKSITESMERMFSEVAKKKGLSFYVTIDDDAPAEIITDGQRANQILKNFLANALKFTDHGSVALHVSRVQEPLEHAGGIAFSVSDTGIGVPEKMRKLIFEEFQQADGTTTRKFGGTGLGLSISTKLAGLLGGGITLSSQEGAGSTFTLILPEKLVVEKLPTQEESSEKKEVSPAVAKSVEPPESVPSVIDDDKETLVPGDRSILIIEDDSLFAEILRDFARNQQFKAVIARDGEAGLEFAELYEPSAILLDVGLPGINGWRVMKKLKDNAKTRHIPVHFITGHQKSVEAMKMGAIGFLTKPVGMQGLLQAFSRIERIIAKNVKNLLIVEDDEERQRQLASFISGPDVTITVTASGYEASRRLASGTYDCLILNVGLRDGSGFQLLEYLGKQSGAVSTPVILFFDHEPTDDEATRISAYEKTIVIKETLSVEEILDEVALFFHRVEAELPEGKKGRVKFVHDKGTVLRGKKILIVDDDMRNVFAITAILEEKGVSVLVGKTGQEALAIFGQHPNIDLVLMDIMLPRMDGYAVMRAIREDINYEKIPIIALTAKAMKGDRGKCIEAGANDYMAKPVDTDKLLSLLQVWLYK